MKTGDADEGSCASLGAGVVPAPQQLEPSQDAMAAMVGAVMEKLLPLLAQVGEQPASYTGDGVALAHALQESMPSTGTSIEQLLAQLFGTIIPTSYNAAGPGYLGYIPGGGVFPSAVADLIANAINRYTGVWIASPGLVQLEVNVLRWFCEMVDYPATAGGWLTSGGSLATLTALTTARSERLPANFLCGTIYTSDQSHHSVQKAAMLAGFPLANVREIPSDKDFCIHIPTLLSQIKQDRAVGLQPFCLVAHAGTTNTGAVEPLEALATIAAQEGLWLHVDAAYGGFFALTEAGKARLQGLSKADSITLDPHKGLFLPYGTGALLVRDLGTLHRTHSIDADYMPAMQLDAQREFSAISPDLSRDYRGLRVWLPLKLWGVDVWRDYLTEKQALALWITAALRELPQIEIVAPPALSLMAFRFVDPALSLAQINAYNQQLLHSINAKQRVFLTGTWLAGRDGAPDADASALTGPPRPRDVFVLRICVLCFRTHFDRMQVALEDIQDSLAALLPPDA